VPMPSVDMKRRRESEVMGVLLGRQWWARKESSDLGECDRGPIERVVRLRP
jgi:hypothetical protein